MDLETIRAQWPNIERPYTILGWESRAAIIERVKRRVARKKLWRRVRRIIPRTALAALAGLAIIQIFVTDRGGLPLQSIALILGLVVVSALNLVEKAREKYLGPKVWLHPRVFLSDEYQRVGRNIYYDQWTSALLGAAIVCLALYVGPFLGARAEVGCRGLAAAAVLVLQVYYRREISDLKLSRADILEEMGDLRADKFGPINDS